MKNTLNSSVISSINRSKDHLGYYQVGDFKTYSKVEAIEVSGLVHKFPVWDFNTDVFSKFNWKKEPQETLGELYAKRARQLREKYDYIVIFYSGGADSGNIVDTFVNNEIPFDEIATYNYFKLDSRKYSFFHGEQTCVSYPKIQKLLQKGVKFKHREIDLSDISAKILRDEFWDSHRAYFGNTHFSTSHLAKTFIREETPDYMKLIEQGKRVVFVWGAEKPHMTRTKLGKLSVEFTEILDSSCGTRTQMMDRPWEHDELFYWGRDCPEIVAKQAHVIKKFINSHLEKNFDPRKFMTEDPVTEKSLLDLFGQLGIHSNLMYRNVLNWLIYPTFEFEMFSLGKPPPNVFTIYSPREQYWLKDTEFRAQSDRLAEHFFSIRPEWYKDKTDARAGFKKFFNSYEIE